MAINVKFNGTQIFPPSGSAILPASGFGMHHVNGTTIAGTVAGLNKEEVDVIFQMLVALKNARVISYCFVDNHALWIDAREPSDG